MSIGPTELVTWEVCCSRCGTSELIPALPPEKGAEDAEALLRSVERGDDGWQCGDEHICPGCGDNGAAEDPQVWAAEAAGSIFRPVDDGCWFGPFPANPVDDLEPRP